MFGVHSSPAIPKPTMATRRHPGVWSPPPLSVEPGGRDYGCRPLRYADSHPDPGCVFTLSGPARSGGGRTKPEPPSRDGAERQENVTVCQKGRLIEVTAHRPCKPMSTTATPSACPYRTRCLRFITTEGQSVCVLHFSHGPLQPCSSSSVCPDELPSTFPTCATLDGDTATGNVCTLLASVERARTIGAFAEDRSEPPSEAGRGSRRRSPGARLRC